MTDEDVAYTLDDLREAFVAGFKSSNDCGYDGAAYEELGSDNFRVTRGELMGNFDEWIGSVPCGASWWRRGDHHSHECDKPGIHSNHVCECGDERSFA